MHLKSSGTQFGQPALTTDDKVLTERRECETLAHRRRPRAGGDPEHSFARTLPTSQPPEVVELLLLLLYILPCSTHTTERGEVELLAGDDNNDDDFLKEKERLFLLFPFCTALSIHQTHFVVQSIVAIQSIVVKSKRFAYKYILARLTISGGGGRQAAAHQTHVCHPASRTHDSI